MKKLLLSVGSLAAIVTPVVAVISCGDKETPTNKPTVFTKTPDELKKEVITAFQEAGLVIRGGNNGNAVVYYTPEIKTVVDAEIAKLKDLTTIDAISKAKTAGVTAIFKVSEVYINSEVAKAKQQNKDLFTKTSEYDSTDEAVKAARVAIIEKIEKENKAIDAITFTVDNALESLTKLHTHNIMPEAMVSLLAAYDSAVKAATPAPLPTVETYKAQVEYPTATFHTVEPEPFKVYSAAKMHEVELNKEIADFKAIVTSLFNAEADKATAGDSYHTTIATEYNAIATALKNAIDSLANLKTSTEFTTARKAGITNIKQAVTTYNSAVKVEKIKEYKHGKDVTQLTTVTLTQPTYGADKVSTVSNLETELASALKSFNDNLAIYNNANSDLDAIKAAYTKMEQARTVMATAKAKVDAANTAQDNANKAKKAELAKAAFNTYKHDHALPTMTAKADIDSKATNHDAIVASQGAAETAYNEAKKLYDAATTTGALDKALEAVKNANTQMAAANNTLVTMPTPVVVTQPEKAAVPQTAEQTTTQEAGESNVPPVV